MEKMMERVVQLKKVLIYCVVNLLFYKEYFFVELIFGFLNGSCVFFELLFIIKEDLVVCNEDFCCIFFFEVCEYVVMSGIMGNFVMVYFFEQDLQWFVCNELDFFCIIGCFEVDIF